MKDLDSLTFVETKKKNRYFYDRKMKRIQLCHPLLFFILKLTREGTDIKSWIENFEHETFEIDGIGRFSKNELHYYYQKYLILKENGLFTRINQEKNLSGIIEPDSIERNLANCKQVVFEVTDECNLDCKYCGYGKFYSDYDYRENKKMDIQSAKRLLNFLAERWNSPLNDSADRNIFISFYGGEPLLNFPFIKAIVEFVERLNVPRSRFTFSMTTNALLLKKYMDFLVEKKFKLLLSLDGNEENSVYRTFKNGKPAYKHILENVNALRTKYPEHFRKHVNFNAVLHNKNSVSGIYRYFKENFNKNPAIGELNTSGINVFQKDEFLATYANMRESLNQSEDYRPIKDDMFIRLPTVQDAMQFIHFNCDFCFEDYNDLIYSDGETIHIPTGTCLPFSKKIYVTVNGKILPCERIGQQFGLGNVTSDGVVLNYRKIADTYNAYFEKIRRQCNVCHNASACKQCIFTLDAIDTAQPVCYGFMTEENYSSDIAESINYIEESPGDYSKILREVVIE